MSETTPTVQALEARLEVLERSRRGLARVAAAALCLALFLLLVDVLRLVAPAPDTLEAEAFVLRDWRGTVRGRLALTGETLPQLELFDEARQGRARLALDESGMTSLQLSDQGGRVCAGLAVMEEGSPRLALIDGAGAPGAQLDARPEHGGRLLLRDAAGEPSFKAP